MGNSERRVDFKNFRNHLAVGKISLNEVTNTAAVGSEQFDQPRDEQIETKNKKKNTDVLVIRFDRTLKMNDLTYREPVRPPPMNQPVVDVYVLPTPIVASPPLATIVDPDTNSKSDQTISAFSGQK